MKKRMTIMAIALFVIFGGIVGFNLFKSFMMKRYFAHFEPPAITVSSVEAKAVLWRPVLSAVGNFVAKDGVDVNAQASGKVVKIRFDSGQYVAKDQPLIDIDDSVEQANLTFNQAELTLKQLNYQRQLDLQKRGATPSSSVDEAKANLQEAQANVDKVQAEIAHKHIQSPFAGLLGIRKVDLGQFIKPGDTAIVSLQSLDPLYLEFHLPEQYLKNIHINQLITFSVEAFPHSIFTGKINAIDSKVDSTTHNIKVQATVPNCPLSALKDPKKSNLIAVRKQPFENKWMITCNDDLNAKNNVHDFVFLPGMFAVIEIQQTPIPNTVVLPSTAISYSLYGNSVFIIEEDKKTKDAKGNAILRVQRVFVTTGEQHGNQTVITSGVKAGQIVVSSGEMKLKNGASVAINNEVKLNEIDKDLLGQ